MWYTSCEIERLRQSKQVVLFGAGAVAEAVVVCLKSTPYQLSVSCCIVSNLKGNPDFVLGVPVVDLVSAEKMLDKNTLIVVAVAEKNLESVMNSLQGSGFKNNPIFFLTYENDLWSLIRGNLYYEQRLKQHKPYLMLEKELQRVKTCQNFSKDMLKIYTVKSHFDRNVQEDTSRFSWEIPIQAGTALTDKNICDVCDNTGDNISYKNRKYCELTALYWIWKNDESAYVGMGHYRRHFEVDETMLEKLVCSDIDVVLTIPIFDYPNVKAVYQRDHVEADWAVMMDALKVLCPEYIVDAIELEKGNFYYAYNMFIMRRKILESYCAWLFPVLEYCEKYCEEKEDIYQNRYIGFLAEHLMAIYFLHHENDYKIVHARKHFILI